jgi:hypothetical protein
LTILSCGSFSSSEKQVRPNKRVRNGENSWLTLSLNLQPIDDNEARGLLTNLTKDKCNLFSWTDTARKYGIIGI